MQDVDLFDVASSLPTPLERSKPKRHKKIYMISPETHIIKADRQEMEIIFNNLVSNAIKYNRENGHVDHHH